MARTWILTGSPENIQATKDRDVTVIGEPRWVAAHAPDGRLEHIAKWPEEHWTLAFQGQFRPVSDHDAQILTERPSAAAGAPA